MGWLRVFFFAAISTSQYSRQEKKLCEKESGHILKIHSIFFLGHPESCFKKLMQNFIFHIGTSRVVDGLVTKSYVLKLQGWFTQCLNHFYEASIKKIIIISFKTKL